MVSTSDYHTQQQGYDSSTYDSAFAAAPRKQDPNQLLMLPAPLSVSRVTPTSASTSTAGLSKSSEEGGYNSDLGSQHQRLIPSPPEGYGYSEEYETPAPQSPFDQRVSSAASANNGVYRQSTAYQQAVETYNPYGYSQPHTVGYDAQQQQFPYTTEPEEQPAQSSAAASRQRGVSLVDNGPVSSSGGVRRISRQTRRSTTQVAPQQNQNRYSRGGSVPMPNQQLPPGAAPPQSGYGY